MKKTIVVLLTILVSMFLFVGCQKIELSEEDEKLIVAYAVDSILKFDYDYPDKLLPVPEVTTKEEESGGAEEETTYNDSSGDHSSSGNNSSGGISSTVEVSMTEVMDISGFSFDITGFQVTKKYSAGNNDSAMTAAEGKNLLIMDVSAKNHNDKVTNLNIISQDIKFTAVVNSNKKMNPQVWVWSDECTFNAYVGDFAAGEKKNLVLAFQVDDDLDINSIRLLIAKGEKEGYITVK